MRRSTALILLGVGVLVAAGVSDSGCLCTYGEPCWPGPSTFSQPQSQVSQQLIYPLPSASVCYPPSDPSGNCTAVKENWGDVSAEMGVSTDTFNPGVVVRDQLAGYVFGSHYSTLKQIKDKYDPYRLFVVAEGVGPEDWNERLTCRY